MKGSFEERALGLPTGRILGIKPTIHYFPSWFHLSGVIFKTAKPIIR